MTFSQNYAEARERFRGACLAAGGRLSAIPIENPDAAHSDHAQADLTIDIAEFGDQPNTLFVSSGVHGVEGFAGSAMQLDWLERGLPADLRVVLVHAVNPYGMAALRRTNENNVDLNRNFLPPEVPYAGASDGYRNLYDLLHPTKPYRSGFDGFVPKAIVQIARHGMPAVQQAVAGGQYDYPKGLFWGGDRLQAGPRQVLERLPTWLQGTQRLVALDLHTGLGRPGTYALRTDVDPQGESLLELIAAYGPRIQAVKAQGSATYEAHGGFIEALTRTYGAPCDALVAEFGTRSALSVIKAMRSENQAHFWGGDIARAKDALRQAFYPERPAWRAAIIDGAREIIERAIARLRR